MAECILRTPSYKEMTIVPAAAAAAGEVITQGSILGFFLITYSAADLALSKQATLIYQAEKVEVIKNTGEVWVPGEPVYWDASNSWFTNVAGVLDLAGFVSEDIASAVLVGLISFDGRSELLVT